MEAGEGASEIRQVSSFGWGQNLTMQFRLVLNSWCFSFLSLSKAGMTGLHHRTRLPLTSSYSPSSGPVSLPEVYLCPETPAGRQGGLSAFRGNALMSPSCGAHPGDSTCSTSLGGRPGCWDEGQGSGLWTLSWKDLSGHTGLALGPWTWFFTERLVARLGLSPSAGEEMGPEVVTTVQ